MRLISILVLLQLAFFTTAYSINLGNYGVVYTVQEENILDYITGKLAYMQNSGALKSHEENFKKNVKKHVLRPKGIVLNPTQSPKVYRYTPTLVLRSDIRNHDGSLLYAKGTVINPLDPSTYPKSLPIKKQINYDTKLIFIDADDNRQLNFTKEMLTKYDSSKQKYKIILVKGNIKSAYQVLDSRVYFDQNQHILKKMKIRHVPTIASQSGDHFKLVEFDISHYSDKVQKAVLK